MQEDTSRDPAPPAHWLSPGDPGYDEARRVWNGMHDRRPAHIARCRTAADVSEALRYAAARGLDVTVRGGGHNVGGSAVADGAVMIDLSPLRTVTVDPVAEVAEAGGGCLLRDLDTATAPYGLACPSGVISHTGLGGLALGGGYGWLARQWGLTCDHILAAEVVLADGTVVEATEESHPELLWALRGGGGNFGVVTRFTLRLRSVGPVRFSMGVYALDEVPHALAAYRKYTERQPLPMHTVGGLKRAGQQEWIPPHLRGKPVLFLIAVWSGDPEDGPARTAELFEEVVPAAHVSHTMSYPQLQALGDESEPKGDRYFIKSCYLDDLSPEAVRRLVEATLDEPSALCSIDFEFLRGAISDVPDEESAFPGRDAPYQVTVESHWTDPDLDEEHIAWARETVARIREFGTGGAYVNYVQEEGDRKASAIYGRGRHARLMAVKKKYDPGNVLRGNLNIRPEGDV
ncbi:FAD-binding oxidoreductase [Streptomyces sp. S.PNR 29]|uniref:FAD-binding oxidoreductase n=1 Tax=Streptomyces sp. S.PNR 29 TaxID=2973805 RepID=UPI0025B23B56|nr:FAD-binding oxidoreductase [Streptomyces sp. S.PNR 29]MDN0200261.1 FAD-binding oxidoreductase [Streptomyces sp. S.PNR 29]